ncbi:MAG: DUF502 domain-containing protein [Verrucomicrobia bacterium]|nr:DUF502 domain-containing protein [Verrucomicrobiota bacterium]MBU4292012.1 DUF502 domain-containing protein [Verrucomicrobiota bacterium]MBU4427900.1 DUF502 domain-containing protein [Verrucomicrobiota bacterium]MCG2678846.1 DUF502 domain-containing protein [Kiritimatiellia bacterium]
MTLAEVSKSFRANMIIGLLLVTPLVVTLIIINFLFTFITDYLVPQAWLQTQFAIVYRLAALIIVVLGLYLIGVLARNIIGRSLYRLGDKVMTRIPVIKSVYIAIRQVSESVIRSRKNMFKQVVIVQFPRLGLHSIGFLTAQLPPDIARHSLGMPEGQDYLDVFVPMGPNPTSGFLLIVSRQDVKPVNISVADAMKMVVSMGAVYPGGKDSLSPSFLDHVEAWMNHHPEASEPSAPSPAAPP